MPGPHRALHRRSGTGRQFAFRFGPSPWIEVKDGEPSVRLLYDAHYSRRRYRDGRDPALYVGPGQKMVLRTAMCDAIFAWRKFTPLDGQEGLNCAFFRNESEHLSSALILDAHEWARKRWPHERRYYTYVNPREVDSPNPGYCFKCAGWKFVGLTKDKGLHILVFEWQ